MASKPVPATAPEYVPTLHMDFHKNAEEVRGLAVGDQVHFIVTGIVQGVEQRESWDDPKEMVASVCLKKYKVQVVSAEDWASKYDNDGDE